MKHCETCRCTLDTSFEKNAENMIKYVDNVQKHAIINNVS